MQGGGGGEHCSSTMEGNVAFFPGGKDAAATMAVLGWT